ncbi:RIB43A-like with coiled-coils protein 2 [Nerophis ophidion]|uniref:RIB43A-like with coiled-coils protein 2 n=1 Tax=Nerophis ophidion TaxID=159077 RepID=UPI002AE08B31|nr:RIB43A-like with coiled-coils protein 2 [Nerophis ophidion]
MMMSNMELLSEEFSKAKLQRRRDIEEKRRARIFADKVRTIGVDKEFLDRQVAEKIARKKAEKKQDDADDAAMLQSIKQAVLLHHQQEKAKRATEKEVVDYHHQYQQGFGPDDLHVGEAHLMLPALLGEDPDRSGRVQRQREQLKAWLYQQRDEQAEEKQRRKMEKLQDDRRRIELDNEALEVQNLQFERRKAAAFATKEWNKMMVSLPSRILTLKNKRSTLYMVVVWMTQREEDHGQESDKDMEYKVGMMGAPGLCPSSDRKPPPESSEKITEFQQHQIEAKRRAELEKKKEELRHDGVRLDTARSAELMERQQARSRKQQRRHVDVTNQHLAASQKHREVGIKRGHIDESFFSKFNTSSR